MKVTIRNKGIIVGVIETVTATYDLDRHTKDETPEELYARTHPVEHRGLSGCCDPPPGLGYGGE